MVRCLIVLLCMTATAAAAPRMKLAVLPIDAVPADPASERVAAEIVVALRAAPTARGNGVLVAAPPRAIAGAKRIAQCTSEALTCMVEIGTTLGADALIYGRLVRRPNGYAINLKLLDVKKRRVQRGVFEVILTRDATGPQLATAVQGFYARLVGN